MATRSEQPADIEAIRRINRLAFGDTGEDALVDRLRAQAEPFISIVAEHEGQLAGHIAFSPVTLHGVRGSRWVGLAPMAVIPPLQNRGIGSQLVQAGLDECRRRHQDAVFVLGHPAYYPRFGFVAAEPLGFQCEYPATPGAWMVLALSPGALQDRRGLVRYHPAFNELP